MFVVSTYLFCTKMQAVLMYLLIVFWRLTFFCRLIFSCIFGIFVIIITIIVIYSFVWDSNCKRMDVGVCVFIISPPLDLTTRFTVTSLQIVLIIYKPLCLCNMDQRISWTISAIMCYLSSFLHAKLNCLVLGKKKLYIYILVSNREYGEKALLLLSRNDCKV